MNTPSTPSRSPNSRGRGVRLGRRHQQQHYHDAPRHSRGRKREKNKVSIQNLALAPSKSSDVTDSPHYDKRRARGHKRGRQKGRRDGRDRSTENVSHDSRSRGKGRSRGRSRRAQRDESVSSRDSSDFPKAPRPRNKGSRGGGLRGARQDKGDRTPRSYQYDNFGSKRGRRRRRQLLP